MDLWEVHAGFSPFLCNCDLLVWQNPWRKREVTRQMATFIFMSLGAEGWSPDWQSSCCRAGFQWVGAPGRIFTPYQLQYEELVSRKHLQGVTKIRSRQRGSSFGCSVSSTTRWSQRTQLEAEVTRECVFSAGNTGRWLEIARPPINPVLKS